jgi:hypothetical protein
MKHFFKFSRCFGLAFFLMVATWAQAQSLTQSAGLDGKVCWKDSYGRGVGTVPGSCGNGETKSGLLCYPKCSEGYNNVAGVCWSSCPKGTTDIGATCVKDNVSSYGRGAGYALWDGDKCDRAHSTDWNDNLDAVRLAPYTVFRGYEHPNYTGQYIEVRTGASELKAELPKEWWNRISSVKIRTELANQQGGGMFNFTGMLRSTGIIKHKRPNLDGFDLDDAAEKYNKDYKDTAQALSWIKSAPNGDLSRSAVKVVLLNNISTFETLELTLRNSSPKSAADAREKVNETKSLLSRLEALLASGKKESDLLTDLQSIKNALNLINEEKLKGQRVGYNRLEGGSLRSIPAADNGKACFFSETKWQGKTFCVGHSTALGASLGVSDASSLIDPREIMRKDARTPNGTKAPTENLVLDPVDIVKYLRDNPGFRIRSAKIDPSVQVTVWDELGFKGKSRNLNSGEWDSFGIFEGYGWANQITSLAVTSYEPNVCFYNATSDLRSSEFRQCVNADKDIPLLQKEGGCEQSGLLHYPKCRNGYDGVGPVCWSTTKCTNGTTDAGLFCTKGSEVKNPKTPSCESSKEYDAGLCYDKCNRGYNGIGPVCWGTCPSSMGTDCGAMCGTSSGECGKQIGGQVVAGVQMVGTIASVAATGGAAAGGITAAKVSITLALKAALKEIAIDLVKRSSKQGLKELQKSLPTGSKAWQMAERGDINGLEQAIEETEFDPSSLDPSGVYDFIKTFDKPKCEYPVALPPKPAGAKSALELLGLAGNVRPAPGAATVPSNLPALPQQIIESRYARGRCVDANTGSGFGTSQDATLLWECSGNPNQRFTYNANAQTIGYPAKNLCLESKGKGQPAQFAACRNDAKQKWTVTAGMQSLKNAGDGMCLDVSSFKKDNGTQIIGWDCTGNTNQQWNFAEQTPSQQAVKLETRFAANKCMDANLSFAGTAVDAALLWDCNGNANQKFNYDSVNKAITYPAKALCLESQGRGKSAQFANCAGDKKQQWSIQTNNVMKNEADGLCLDVSGPKSANGTAIITWDCNNNNNQQWNFKP